MLNDGLKLMKKNRLLFYFKVSLSLNENLKFKNFDEKKMKIPQMHSNYLKGDLRRKVECCPSINENKIIHF